MVANIFQFIGKLGKKVTHMLKWIRQTSLCNQEFAQAEGESDGGVV